MRPSLLTLLCTSLLAVLPRWSFLALLPISCFKHVWHRFLGCLSLLFGAVRALSLSQARLLSARDLQHRTKRLRCVRRLRCCLLEVGHRHVLDFAASHHLGHLYLLRHVWTRDNFLRNLGLSLKLFNITSTRGFQDVRIPIELEMRISWFFSL